MNIDEAIAHAEEVASRKFDDRVHCIKCAEEHAQLAKWLKELKNLKMREQYKNDFGTFKENQAYKKALDDLMQKIVCDRTLLDGWQLRAIQRKANQLKEVHHA